MKRIKNVDSDLSWKLVWDEETKDVLIFKQIKGKFETINNLFEASDKTAVYDKINQLGLKYDPSILEEEWI
jgi:hypothetical protein